MLRKKKSKKIALLSWTFYPLFFKTSTACLFAITWLFDALYSHNLRQCKRIHLSSWVRRICSSGIFTLHPQYAIHQLVVLLKFELIIFNHLNVKFSYSYLRQIHFSFQNLNLAFKFIFFICLIDYVAKLVNLRR